MSTGEGDNKATGASAGSEFDKLINVSDTSFREIAGELADQQTLRESGDVFRHLPWRKVFAAFTMLPETHLKLRNLSSKLLYRAKEQKNQHKMQAVTFNVPLPNDTKNPNIKKFEAIFKGKNSFNIVLYFPGSQSNVKDVMLTPERLKCVMKVLSVPWMVEEKILPATSMSIGYDKILEKIIEYEDLVKMSETERAKNDKDKIHASIVSFLGKVGNQYTPYFSRAAVIAGSVSSKEIYMEDENDFPGCIWWAGIHAFMTDCSCKLRAPKVSVDKRERMQESTFYPDFRRKLKARGIVICDTDHYISFLELLTPWMTECLLAGTPISREEAQIMDRVLEGFRKRESENAKGQVGKIEETRDITKLGTTEDQITLASKYLTEFEEEQQLPQNGRLTASGKGQIPLYHEAGDLCTSTGQNVTVAGKCTNGCLDLAQMTPKGQK